LRLLLAGSSALFGVALLIAGWAPTILGVVFGLLIYGLAEGMSVPSLQEATAGRAPSEQRGTVLAAWVAAVRLGQTTGPLLFSAIFAAIGTGPTLMLGAALAIPLIALNALSSVGQEPDVMSEVRQGS
jgi:sugar phosphate permease